LGFREQVIATFPTRNLELERGFTMIAKMKLFLVDDNGATAIEYGLIAAGISVAIIIVVPAIGGKLFTAFDKVSGSLN
jgi:pilus assembly protein Flp/PilA